MIKNIYGLLLLVFLYSCRGSITDNDQTQVVDPTPVPVTLTLHLNRNMPDSLSGKDHNLLIRYFNLRYIVDVYAESGSQKGQRIKRIVEVQKSAIEQHNECFVEMDLPPATYSFRVWCDFVLPETTTDYLFVTDNLSEVHYKNSYAGEHAGKEAYSANETLIVSAGSMSLTKTINLQNAFGRVRIISTDLQQFMESKGIPLQDLVVKASYKGYAPAGFSVPLQFAPAQFLVTGLGFQGRLSYLTEQEAQVTWDNIFVCQDETILFMDLLIYNQASVLISQVSNLRIPLYRNTLTLLKGKYLTRPAGDGGDIGIDDKFEDEIVVDIPD